MPYYTTIGLEIHAELKTETKMFCNSKNDPDEESPNVNICPVCMAHPGTLPVINKKAVEHVVKVGLALGGTIANFTEFDRKNYFYPDIPKGYQISQYKYPIVSGGELSGVKITRVHLEEDTATSKHDNGDYSLVDYNRAGVPLMELVTEPVIHSPEEAGAFGRELQLLLKYLGVSEANMEKGEMRVELNISISPDEKVFGTKVEVKNINSFKAVERAAKFEIERMSKLLDEGRGNEIIQETRGWDEGKQSTFSQRSKENSEEYRYFPDPDLPKLMLSEVFNLDAMREELPELPQAKRERYVRDYGIKSEDIESYVNDPALAGWFEEIALHLNSDKDLSAQAGKIKVASNYITSDFLGLKKNDSEIKTPDAHHFAELVEMIADGSISSRGAKDILAIIVKESGSPKEIAESRGLIQKNDEGAIIAIAEKVIVENPEIVETYRGGKENALMSLVGKIMKESGGSANPALAQKVLKELLQK
ncbi:MAG: Asp-tRNA(Asn)/Glu-tRNA(Gln) amidotransferase subunit GatB [Candidatus Paceibacterota bacterium]|jgi:aspartyl-tRNA(Asn)/glutamyl-tRNA(Gln) amidotransferase subunit B